VGAYRARPATNLSAMKTPLLTGTIHLGRHGEVENPKGVIYGRLPGYNLSARGQQQAKEASTHLANADVGAVYSSPLERAQETAHIIAEPHDLSLVTDERFTESSTTFEGIGRTLWSFATSPRHWWRLRNPWLPTWGESFADIRERMLEGIADAFRSAGGREVVVVSHQTPILVARLALARRSVPPWLSGVPCQTGSVTTMVVEDGRVLRGSYFVPTA
jgi:broad specificity phosphatase PhoE